MGRTHYVEPLQGAGLTVVRMVLSGPPLLCALGLVEETREPELSDRYDYYAVPCFYVDGEKVFEARLFMSYEDIKAGTRAALDAAL